MKTFSAKEHEVQREWHLVDAENKVLGRLASEVASRLRGKHKPEYTPHVDTGDYIVVINADKIALTGKKLKDKMYYKHTKWMGSLTATSAGEMLAKHPTRLIEFAVKGMLPKNRLGSQMMTKLKIHAGPAPEHGYSAQKAQVLELK
jgi:large subunit ribosomal protein L13